MRAFWRTPRAHQQRCSSRRSSKTWTLQLTYWLNYDRLLHDEQDAELSIHQGVLQLLTMVAPYLGEDQIDFYRQCEAIFEGMLKAKA